MDKKPLTPPLRAKVKIPSNPAFRIKPGLWIFGRCLFIAKDIAKIKGQNSTSSGFHLRDMEESVNVSE